MMLPGHLAEQKKPSGWAFKISMLPVAQIREQESSSAPFRKADGKAGLVDSMGLALSDIT